MNYYVRTQQALMAHDALTQRRLAGMHALRLRGMGDSTAGLPAGSQLAYSATFNVPMFSWSGTNLATALQTISSQLGSYAIRMINKNYSQNGQQWQVAMAVLTQSDRNAASDVQGILDGLLSQQGAQSISSQIAVVNPASVVATTPPGIDPNTGLPIAQPGWAQWLDDNTTLIALGGVAFLAFKLLEDL